MVDDQAVDEMKENVDAIIVIVEAGESSRSDLTVIRELAEQLKDEIEALM